MTYSRQSEILIPYADELRDLGDEITGWFDKIGPDYARWLNTPYMPVPRNYGDLIVEWCLHWRPAIREMVGRDVVPDPRLVAAQIAHEAAGGQSFFFRERRNPSGLGAVNHNPDQAIEFATHSDGVRATVAHVLSYAAGTGPWVEHDPRAEAMPGNWFGIVKVLADYEQRWAFTPQAKYASTPAELRYGGRVAVLGNDLLEWIATHANDRPRIAMPPWHECIITPAHAGRPGLPLAYQWVTMHDTDNRSQGADEAAHCAYLMGGAGGRDVSWHATVGDSGFWQHLPWDEVAWHAGDGYNGEGNRSSLAIEGTVDLTQDFEAAWKNWVWAAAWALDRRDLPVSRLVQHNHWKSSQYPSGKNCPRWLRESDAWGRFVADVDAQLKGLTRPGDQVVVDDPNARYFEATRHWVINLREVRMLDLWEEFGGLTEPDPVGHPLGGMVQDEDGVYRQLFENRLLEVWPDGTARSGGLGQRYVQLLEECRAA